MVTAQGEAAFLDALAEDLRSREVLYVGVGVAIVGGQSLAESPSPTYRRVRTVPADWEWRSGKVPRPRMPISYEGWAGPVAQLGVFAEPEGGTPLLMLDVVVPVNLRETDVLTVKVP